MLVSLKAFAPELTLVGFLSLLFLLDGFVPKLRENRFPLIWVIVSCFAAGVATAVGKGLSGDFFSGLVTETGLVAFFVTSSSLLVE